MNSSWVGSHVFDPGSNFNIIFVFERFFLFRSVSNLLFCIIYIVDFLGVVFFEKIKSVRDTSFLACKYTYYLWSTLSASHFILTLIVSISQFHLVRSGPSLGKKRFFTDRYSYTVCALAFLLPALLKFPETFWFHYNQNFTEKV